MQIAHGTHHAGLMSSVAAPRPLVRRQRVLRSNARRLDTSAARAAHLKSP